jgi:hypothetical protein
MAHEGEDERFLGIGGDAKRLGAAQAGGARRAELLDEDRAVGTAEDHVVALGTMILGVGAVTRSGKKAGDGQQRRITPGLLHPR